MDFTHIVTRDYYDRWSNSPLPEGLYDLHVGDKVMLIDDPDSGFIKAINRLGIVVTVPRSYAAILFEKIIQ